MKKLKNKKGFTLVELIVVIAIIAVLAAILIPTLLSYTVRSQVSNVNTTAGKMRDNINYFLTQADADGYGMFMSSTAVCQLEITIDDKKWKVDVDDPTVFVDHYTTTWGTTGYGWFGDNNSGSSIAEARLASYLANTFRDVVTGYAKCELVGGTCTLLYLTLDQNTPDSYIPAFNGSGSWPVDSLTWDGRTQGVTPNGNIVGTSPLLPMT